MEVRRDKEISKDRRTRDMVFARSTLCTLDISFESSNKLVRPDAVLRNINMNSIMPTSPYANNKRQREMQ